MSIQVIKNAWAVITKKPIKLWGISLLGVLLMTLGSLLGGPIPIIAIAVTMVVELSMAWIYLDGYRGKDVNVEQVFDGFKNFKRSFCVMGWRKLIVFIWTIVPMVIGGAVAYILGKAAFAQVLAYLKQFIGSLFSGYGYGYGFGYGSYGFNSISAFDRGIMMVFGVLAIIALVAGIITGIVFYCIKSYAYAVVPYIIRDDADTNAFDVAKKSVAMTNGYKGKMFLTDVIIVVIIAIVEGILGAFGAIPYIGFIFNLVGAAVGVVVAGLTPVFMGLVRAAWFEEIMKGQNQTQE